MIYSQIMLARIEQVSTVIKEIVEFLPEGEQLTIAVDGIGKQYEDSA